MIDDRLKTAAEKIQTDGECVICKSRNIAVVGFYQPRNQDYAEFLTRETTEEGKVQVIAYGLCEDHMPDEDIAKQVEEFFDRQAREVAN